jgi:hypothetical protein
LAHSFRSGGGTAEMGQQPDGHQTPQAISINSLGLSRLSRYKNSPWPGFDW